MKHLQKDCKVRIANGGCSEKYSRETINCDTQLCKAALFPAGVGGKIAKPISHYLKIPISRWLVLIRALPRQQRIQTTRKCH